MVCRNAEGWLEQAVIPEGKTRRVALRLTTLAKRMCGLDRQAAGSTNRASLTHEYWKHFYAERFRREGYAVEVEAPCSRGFVDVLAKKGQESIGIEIETGKSDVVANVKRCLRSGFNRVIVVATDEQAFRRIERSLTLRGLLIPGKVRVVMGKDDLGTWTESANGRVSR